jgi:glycosyltransferase involved in cell wall biosynthesis
VAGVFIGHENPNHQAYCKKFKKMIAASRSRYTGGVTHEEKIAIVRRSKVHVSASWFEVASGVDLEAYCAGCSVVSSRCGGTDEILGESARYVDPGSPQEIDRAIASALAEKAAAHKEDAPMPLLETWQDVGLKLAALYQQVLEDSREKTLTPSSLMPQSDAGHDQMEAD